MLKTIARLEYKVDERIYQFLCELDSPTSDIRLVIQEINKFIDNLEEVAKGLEIQKEEKKAEESQSM